MLECSLALARAAHDQGAVIEFMDLLAENGPYIGGFSHTAALSGLQ